MRTHSEIESDCHFIARQFYHDPFHAHQICTYVDDPVGQAVFHIVLDQLLLRYAHPCADC
jgi:hypothetical protein